MSGHRESSSGPTQPASATAGSSAGGDGQSDSAVTQGLFLVNSQRLADDVARWVGRQTGAPMAVVRSAVVEALDASPHFKRVVMDSIPAQFRAGELEASDGVLLEAPPSATNRQAALLAAAVVHSHSRANPEHVTDFADRLLPWLEE